VTVTRKTTRLAHVAPWIAGALCALLPLTSQALGLGRLKVHSALNQPLNAEIEFTSLAEAETRGLSIGLASRGDFAAAGIDRAEHLAQIKFTVHRRADGRYVLQLTTPTPFREPFLHVLLQLDWTGGRLVREYTALIDPPTVVAAKAPPVETPRTVVPKTEPGAPLAPAEIVPLTPAVTDESLGPSAEPGVTLSADGWPSEAGEGAATVAPRVAAPRAAAKGRIGPAPSWARTARHTVRRGETLWSISKKVLRDPKVSIQQAALAIYRHNPDAFYDDNLNNIRSGKILRMPARAAVEVLSREQAHVEFQQQFDAWQEHKRRLASAGRTVAVDDTAARESPAAAEKEKPKTAEAPAEKKTAAPAKGPRSDELLKIVRAELKGGKAADASRAAEPSRGGEREQAALAERADTLDESLASKQVEQKALREKLDLVRAQLKREARLIELESQALAPAPDKTAALAEPAKVEPPKAEAPKAEIPGVVRGRTDNGAKDAKAEAPKPETKTEAAVPAAPAKDAKAEAPKPAPKKPVPPPPPPAEKDMFGGLLSSLGDLFLPIVLGVVVLASAVIGFIYLRRRRRATAEFEESILASQAVATTENIPTREATADASAAESSILSDISQGHIANIHTDEVDPIAEAEVYLAYGRDETAEEILKDAMVKHPQRQELKIKLLEIYAGRKDVKAFETLAEEVYAAVGGQGGKLWARVEELGQKVSPANPMFRGTGAAPARAPEEKQKPAVVSAAKGATAVAPTEVATPPAAMPPETALDFDLGAPAVTVPAAAKEDTFDLDFDLGEAKPAPAAPAAGDKKPEPAPALEKDAIKPAGGTDFDLGLESFDLGTPSENTVDFDLGRTSVTPVAPPKAASEPSAGGDFSFDLASPETGTSPSLATDTPAAPPAGGGSPHQWDEAATKLDLARAYIDMGDAEGARSILEEVMAEGNPEQKKQAQDLVAQIR